MEHTEQELDAIYHPHHTAGTILSEEEYELFSLPTLIKQLPDE